MHFFFLNVVDFFQRIFGLDSKQLNLERLQFLKELFTSAVFFVCEPGRSRDYYRYISCAFQEMLVV